MPDVDSKSIWKTCLERIITFWFVLLVEQKNIILIFFRNIPAVALAVNELNHTQSVQITKHLIAVVKLLQGGDNLGK